MARMEDLILHGDVYSGLDSLEDESISVAITSPPYWRQRDYGFKGQIGREERPEEYIGKLVAIFRKLRQKMRKDGVFFLNVGDKYLQKYGKSHLLQIPYRLAYHMVKDGWILEDIIIWYKPNHMPSSVKDRFTNTYEPVLVFSKEEKNIYLKSSPKVVKIRLEQTPWKHTAVFPEKLVEEMLNRVQLEDGDLVLDPFAGTGTVASVVRKLRSGPFPKKVYSIMIEKGEFFIRIIKERAGIREVRRVEDVEYEWSPVEEEKIPKEIPPKVISSERDGEVFIAENSEDFLSALRGISTEDFKNFHREDALYFFGVKKWRLEDLYYAHSIFYDGYVLRNMLVISAGGSWFPVFMFARDTTRVEYKFYLDRVRVKPKTEDRRDWWREEFLGAKVRDLSSKRPREGRIVKVLSRYEDGFPRIVLVKWDGSVSLEFVLHPERGEILMEGLKFLCPKCGAPLEEPYDPVGENKCPICGSSLWNSLDTLPKVKEPEEISRAIEEIKRENYNFGEIMDVTEFERRKETRSKFVGLERINWGASPGARKLILGEYFTKMRIYRVDQPTVAQYLTILRKSRGMSIKDVIRSFPDSYKHTVGHWFRKDFGGSVPIPEDVPRLKEILGREDPLLNALERTALKFQTVKTSIKGKNPGDFIEGISEEDLKNYLRKLYLPAQKYLSLLGKSLSRNSYRYRRGRCGDDQSGKLLCRGFLYRVSSKLLEYSLQKSIQVKDQCLPHPPVYLDLPNCLHEDFVPLRLYFALRDVF